MREFVCENCGKKFESEAHHAKYCPECRTKIDLKKKREHYAKDREKYLARAKKYAGFNEQICETCGKKFVGYKGVKYCSRECKVIGIRKKRGSADKNFEQFCEEHRDDYLFYMREYFLQHHKKFINNMHNYARWQMKNLQKKSVVKSDENVQNVRL